MSKTNNQQETLYSKTTSYDIEPILTEIDNNNRLSEELLHELQNISSSLQAMESSITSNITTEIDVSGESNVTSLTDKLKGLLDTVIKVNDTIGYYKKIVSGSAFKNIGKHVQVYEFHNSIIC